jgi:hypothetical protein
VDLFVPDHKVKIVFRNGSLVLSFSSLHGTSDFDTMIQLAQGLLATDLTARKIPDVPLVTKSNLANQTNNRQTLETSQPAWSGDVDQEAI